MDIDAYKEEQVARQRKWDLRFLDLAAYWGDRCSKDPSTKVGAVIVDEQQRLVSLGFNGFPRGVDDSPDRYLDRPKKYTMVVHAEANAILTAGRQLQGCTLYSSLLTCNECAKLVIQSGISRVVAPELFSANWLEAHRTAIQMYSEAGVKVDLLRHE